MLKTEMPQADGTWINATTVEGVAHLRKKGDVWSGINENGMYRSYWPRDITSYKLLVEVDAPTPELQTELDIRESIALAKETYPLIEKKDIRPEDVLLILDGNGNSTLVTVTEISYDSVTIAGGIKYGSTTLSAGVHLVYRDEDVFVEPGEYLFNVTFSDGSEYDCAVVTDDDILAWNKDDLVPVRAYGKDELEKFTRARMVRVPDENEHLISGDLRQCSCKEFYSAASTWHERAQAFAHHLQKSWGLA